MRIGTPCALSLLIAGAIAAPSGVVAQEICDQWSLVEPPAGATLAVTEVAVRSADEAYAFATPLGLVRWDGDEWSQFPISIIEDLQGEWSNVWIDAFALFDPSYVFIAARGQVSPFATDQILLMWDGSDWSYASLTLEPDLIGAPRNGAAEAVIGTGPDDVWIIGLADGLGDGVNGRPLLTVHWDGNELTEYVTPGVGNRQNNAYDAVAIASDDMWFVGNRNNTGGGDPYFHGITYHWDGTSWNYVPNPSEDIDSSHLRCVTAVASDDVWAAGETPDGPLFMHWDGSEWTIVPSPASTGTVYQIDAIASNDIWAVDAEWQVPVEGKYYHWNGSAWNVVTPPAIPGAFSVSRHGGLAAVSSCDVWAVGSISFGQGQGVSPFIERLGTGSGTVDVPSVTQDRLQLAIAPNPMFRTTDIRFALSGALPSRARIYDVRGSLVRTLFDDVRERDHVSWDGRDDFGQPVVGGVYFVRLESTDGQTLTRKLTVVR